VSTPQPALTLPEQLWLLALHRDEQVPTLELGPPNASGLAGAVLVELVLRGAIKVSEQDVVVVDPSPTKDRLLDQALARIRRRRPRTVKQWLLTLSSLWAGLPRTVRRSLRRGGMLRPRVRLLWLLPTRQYVVPDHAVVEQVQAGLRRTLLGADEPDPRGAALAGLVVVSGMIGACGLSGREASRAEQRALAIIEGKFVGLAISTVLREMRAAMTAAVAASPAGYAPIA
jgi:hypothetical protein